MNGERGSSASLLHALVAVCALCWALSVQSVEGQSQTGQLSVDASPQNARKIPDNMFGIFFEEINHAGAGGLWAELVSNRGGNYVMGNYLRNAFRWSETVGPWEERPGHFNDVWGYWTDDGLGFFEFLQAIVSEYAVTGNDAGKGTLVAALAEAAFLIGLEKNSDVVEMASCAPLFVNDNDRSGPLDENSFQQPEKVAPVSSPIANARQQMGVSVSPYSLASFDLLLEPSKHSSM
ncbi:hypothetical protein PR202_ga28736 [Eleusine coracana subsp. coracana]|uniref:non-reducing end alpha-L-arabinofuranosidase n=1 Tax=Eleusine coracana subsp. coracana TaxID=191504 RepID=A0AAV5DKE0_ELECO|nr:hypothetical protein PR202_ga28736 [Eleusine coracana subsp. coracana]